MGAYVSVAQRRERNRAASQRAIDERQTLSRGSTRVGQPGVTSQDILRASEVSRIRNRNRGRG